jgi:hypothetical protein
MDSTVLWDVMLCSLVVVYRRFGRIYYLHFQGRRISRTNNQQKYLNNSISVTQNYWQ